MEEISKSLKIIRLLKQVMVMLKHNAGNKFKGTNLTALQVMIIGILSHFGQMKISNLSETVGLSNSAISGIIDRLEKQGLVERIRSTDDRRVVYVNVTDKSKKYSHGRFESMEKDIESFMSKATPEELDTILKGLDTMKKIMERQNEKDV